MSRDPIKPNELLDYINDSTKKYIEQLKEDNARWTCKHTAAEQKYQTQSNVIAELRKELEITRLAYEGLQVDCVTRGEYDSLLDKHTASAKAVHASREKAQKLKEAIEHEMSLCNGQPDYFFAKWIKESISTLYPLDREDKTNES